MLLDLEICNPRHQVKEKEPRIPWWLHTFPTYYFSVVGKVCCWEGEYKARDSARLTFPTFLFLLRLVLIIFSSFFPAVKGKGTQETPGASTLLPFIIIAGAGFLETIFFRHLSFADKVQNK